MPGFFEFLAEASQHFDVVIFSSRSATNSGIQAMEDWLYRQFTKFVAEKALDADNLTKYLDALQNVRFPITKPAAFVTLDDRALTFVGSWPDVASLRAFKPWNK